VLTIRSVTVGYGRSDVLHNVSLEVGPAEKIAILGANGAGKTTLLRAISGELRPRLGQITLDGEDLVGCRPDKIVRKGIVHVPEGKGIFGGMTVRDNLLVGAHVRKRTDIQSSLDNVLEEFPSLKAKFKARASTLSGGQQQMLAIGRGLMANPRVLLLDEPTIGLAPLAVEELVNAVSNTGASRSTAIILVEQNVPAALACATFIHVVNQGRIVASGPAEELNQSKLLENYLGESVSVASEVPE
jgi:branched-chain amino acid transport system ATP-binding protein